MVDVAKIGLSLPGGNLAPGTGLCGLVPLCLGICCFAAGCGGETPAQPPARKPVAGAVKVPPRISEQRQTAPSFAVQPPLPANTAPRPANPPPAAPPEKTLADLLARAAAEEFRLPQIDDAKVATAGIRKVTGKHLTLYTDVPAAPDVDELPAIFDQAVPQWNEYFGVAPQKSSDWKLVGYLIRDKERFVGTGLFPPNLPDFPNGFQRDSEFWWYDQPSAYYRRHLMLHEGTHAFMSRFLGGGGPPWYMEGMAELLGLHAWRDNKLELAYMPKSNEEVPYWGRVKTIRDHFAAGKGLLLEDVFRYDAQAHLRVEAYGWSWAAAAFLDGHPLTQAAFRELKHKTSDRSLRFSEQFVEQLKSDWPAVREDWELFVVNAEYGYDVARSAVVRSREAAPLPSSGAAVTIAADRAWQSTGLKLAAGKRYRISASGRYQIASEPKTWWCEPGGVTIRYHRSQPLGVLLAAVGDVEPAATITPLAAPRPVGLAAELSPQSSGTLYLKINDSPAELSDNAGTLRVEVRPR